MTTPLKEVLNIDCHPSLAFDLMADIRHETSWNEGASSCEMLTEGPVGKGSRFVSVHRGQEMNSTITTYERPERLKFAITSKSMDVDGTFHFSESGGGTRLDIQFEAQPKGFMKVLFPFLKPVIRRDLVKQHLRFADYCKAQGSSSPQAASGPDLGLSAGQ